MSARTLKRLELNFGALAPHIGQQLFDAGIVPDGMALKHWQKDAEAIVRLNIRGLLTDSAAHQSRQKLMNKIAKHCAAHAKRKGAKRKGRRHG